MFPCGKRSPSLAGHSAQPLARTHDLRSTLILRVSSMPQSNIQSMQIQTIIPSGQPGSSLPHSSEQITKQSMSVRLGGYHNRRVLIPAIPVVVRSDFSLRIKPIRWLTRLALDSPHSSWHYLPHKPISSGIPHVPSLALVCQ